MTQTQPKTTTDYQAFLERKTQLGNQSGFKPLWMPDFLFPFQRACVLWSNPGEVVFTPFMGVGSEVYGAVLNGRKGIGAELKAAYYQQAVRNLAAVEDHAEQELIAV